MDTDSRQMDEAITILRGHKDRWAKTAVRDRIRLLDAIASAYVPLCETWVELGLDAKDARQDAYAAGWEWAGGPIPILRLLAGLRRTLVALEQTGRPPLPAPLITRPNGQVAVRVYPTSLYERLSTPGTTAEVWMEPDLSAAEVRDQEFQMSGARGLKPSR